MRRYKDTSAILTLLGFLSLALGASFPPESGLAAPTDDGSTASPYDMITAGGSFMPSIAVANPSPAVPVAPTGTSPSIVLVPPTMPPAVANFVKKVKAAMAALSASLLVPAV